MRLFLEKEIKNEKKKQKRKRKENVTELAYINDSSSRRSRSRRRAPVVALNIERAAAKWQLTCLCQFAAALHVPH